LPEVFSFSFADVIDLSPFLPSPYHAATATIELRRVGTYLPTSSGRGRRTPRIFSPSALRFGKVPSPTRIVQCAASLSTKTTTPPLLFWIWHGDQPTKLQPSFSFRQGLRGADTDALHHSQVVVDSPLAGSPGKHTLLFDPVRVALFIGKASCRELLFYTADSGVFSQPLGKQALLRFLRRS